MTSGMPLTPQGTLEGRTTRFDLTLLASLDSSCLALCCVPDGLRVTGWTFADVADPPVKGECYIFYTPNLQNVAFQPHSTKEPCFFYNKITIGDSFVHSDHLLLIPV